MTSVVRDLWPYLCRAALLTAFVVVLLVVTLLSGPSWLPFSLITGLLAGGLLLTLRTHRWLWLFVGRTRQFLTASRGRIVLRYAPELSPAVDPGEVLDL